MADDDQQLWWHYYGAEMPVGIMVIGAAAIGNDLEGPPTFAIALVRTVIDPDGVRVGSGSPIKSPIYVIGPEHPEYALQYLGSWDHLPTEAEVNFATPAKWRDPSDLN